MPGTIIEAVETPLPDRMPSAPGWRKFETEKLEILLPDSYVGGDPKRDLQGVIERSTQLGPIYEHLSKLVDAPKNEAEFRRAFAKNQSKGKIRSDNLEFFFRAFDLDAGFWQGLDSDGLREGFCPSALVLHESVGLLRRRGPLPTYLSKNLKDFRSQMGGSVLEQSIVGLGPYEAGRAVVEIPPTKPRLFGSAARGMRSLIYAIKDRSGFWQLQLSGAINDWDRLLPIFEESAATLRLKEVDVA